MEGRQVFRRDSYGYSLDEKLQKALFDAGLMQDAETVIKCLQGSERYRQCVEAERRKRILDLNKQLEDLQRDS